MLLGRSGSGKTTCLKLINRLLTPSSGEVWVEGRSTGEWDVSDCDAESATRSRMSVLFPHYSVRENVALVPRLEKWSPQRIGDRVAEVLQLVGLAAGEFARAIPRAIIWWTETASGFGASAWPLNRQSC